MLCEATTTGPNGCWPGDLVVVENKAGDATVSAIDQLAGYLAELRMMPKNQHRRVHGLVIANGPGDRATRAAAAHPDIRIVTWFEAGYWDYSWFGATSLNRMSDRWCRGGPDGAGAHRPAEQFSTLERHAEPDSAASRRFRVTPNVDDRKRAFEVTIFGNLVLRIVGDKSTIAEINREVTGLEAAGLRRFFSPNLYHAHEWTVTEVTSVDDTDSVVTVDSDESV